MYCEKPLSVTLAEGLALRQAVQKYGVVFQWGTQQRSSQNYRLTAELVRNGYIGEVKTIMIGSAGGGPPKPENHETLEEPPPGFDYNRWLGPAPRVPYSGVRVSRTWMFIRDYDHKQNFLDAIRKRAQPISPITAAAHAETMCQQSEIAMQLQRKLRWDPKAERFINDEQANRMLSRAIRAPWTCTI